MTRSTERVTGSAMRTTAPAVATALVPDGNAPATKDKTKTPALAGRPAPCPSSRRVALPKGRVPGVVLVSGLAVALTAVTVLAVSTGALHVNGLDVLRTIGDHLGIADASSVPATARVVVWDVRLPRTLLALVVGGGLALAGAALQGIYRNPLADPGIIGVSSGAALGAVLSIVVGIGSLGSWTTPVSAFVGALAVSVLVYRLSRRAGRTEVVTLVLTGIALNAIVVAVIGFMTARASDQQLRSIVFWQLGSFANARWQYVAVAGTTVGVGLAVIPALARKLDLLALGEREARHLGVETERLRRIVIGVAALMVAGCVAVSGIVAFVGLVVPHLVRLAAGPRHRLLLVASTLAGSTLLVIADLSARTLAAPQELPLGIVTSGVGGLFFLWLLQSVRRSQGGWA